MASFFRRFIPNFASIIAPLTELTRESVDFKWSDEVNSAFTKIKVLLISKPVLGIFNPKAEKTELHTDASSGGPGAILLQSDERGMMHMIFAVSRRTSMVERNYHSSKLELMAVVWAVERLRTFLISLKFTIVTDCQALVYLNVNKTMNPQVVRWSSALAEYDFEIKHRKGISMHHVDASSRAPIEDSIDEELMEQAYMFQLAIREEEILMYQQIDSELKRKIQILSKNRADCSKADLDSVRDYSLHDGILYRKIVRNGSEVELYVVPSVMRKAIAIKYHDLCSHFGLDKTLARVQEYYYLPRMRNYLKMHIAQCLECMLSKISTGQRAGELHPIVPGNRPFAKVHIDHISPFITSNRGSKYILGVIDTLTKYVVFEPVPNTSAAATVRKLENFISRFGAPDRIISDRGTSFTAKKFEEMCSTYGIIHTLNSSRHPQANGLIERMNQTLLPALIIRTEQGERMNWESEVKAVERDVNSTISKSTGKTPFEMLLGYKPRFEEGRIRELTRNCATYIDPTIIREEAKEKIAESQNKYKQRYDQHRNATIKYAIGDIVYVKVDHTATGESTKLRPQYKGPYVITVVLKGDTYVIKRLMDERQSNRVTTAHVSQLKLWRGRNNINNEIEYEQIYSSDDDNEEKEKQVEIVDEKENDNKDKTREQTKRRRQRPLHLRDYVCNN